jgi:adenosylcobinamide-GDP ribazoletransferase
LKAASASPFSARARQIAVAAAWSPRCQASTPAFTDGASAAAGRTGRLSFLIGIGFAAGFTFILAGPARGLIPVALAFILAALIAWGWAWTCRRLVGGQTGDLIGALQALIEAAALTAFLVSSAGT